MKKQFIKNTLSIALMLGIAACSDNDGNQNIDLSGQVIDGYLENALVCLDLNDNDMCDASEPSQRTNSMGEYSFQAGESGAKQYRVIAIIDLQTRDSDNENADGSNDTVLADAMYSTPPGKRLLSPLTTLVDHELRTATSGTSIMALEKKVKESLSLDMGVNLFSDHVKLAKTDSKYIQVHSVARVVAKSLAKPGSDEAGKSSRDILKSRVVATKAELDGQAHFFAAIVDYDAVPEHDMAMMMAGMSHLRAELENFDPTVEPDMAAMREGMAHLRTELEGFDSSNMPGMSGMNGMSEMGDMSEMSDTPECPEGQRWYTENEIPGMAAMCM